MHLALKSICVLSLALPPLAAQNIVGYAAIPGGPGESLILQNLTGSGGPGTCAPPSILCTTAPPAPLTGRWYEGGFAFDPIRGNGGWSTNGTQLWYQRIANPMVCVPQCTVAVAQVLPPQPVTDPQPRVGGLTIDVRRQQLAHAESFLGTGAIRLYSIAPGLVCPTPLASCVFALPFPDSLVGGIAYDGRRDVFYVVSTRATGPALDTRIQVIQRLPFPTCTAVCTLTLPATIAPCVGLGPIRGLAYDPCPQNLYVTDGRQTVAFQTGGTAACPSLTSTMTCCFLMHPAGQIWHGIDVPRRPGRLLGSSCTGAPCPACPLMTIAEVGHSVVGNLAFGFQVQNAPAGGTAFFFLSNTCVSPGLPFFCGQIHLGLTPPWPVGFGTSALTGVPPCGGTGTALLPIPLNYSLCNLSLCVQAIVVCPAPGGIGVTPAASFVIQ